MCISSYGTYTHFYNHFWEDTCGHCAILWEPSPARGAQSLLGRYQGGTHEGKLCI